MRNYKTRDFRSAVSLIVEIAFVAESMDHHPTITNTYNSLTFQLSTHDGHNKVTAKDVELAHAIEKLLQK